MYTSTMDAITRGALDGVGLLINITAMLLVLVALVALANMALGLVPDLAGRPVTLQRLLGYALAPLAWLMGIPWAEAETAGALLGTKIVLNELIGYLELARLPEGALSAHSRLIMTYALCSFANFASLGIMIGGLAVIAPSRRDDVVALGLRSIVSGTLATCLTAAIVGLL
jgi:CNT family concentrative nucleoside transporter